MINNVKLKLTLWYLLIIMGITISFSGFVYVNVRTSTQRAISNQKNRIVKQLEDDRVQPMIMERISMLGEKTLAEISQKTFILLVVVDILIFVSSGILSYILAGITLNPIEEMLKRQKRFVSDAAHELKTPLTTIKTDIEVTLRDKKLSLEEAKLCLQETNREIDKLSDLAHKLLLKSKAQNGYTKEHLERVSIDKIVEEVCYKLTNTAKKNNMHIKKSLKSVYIMADRLSLTELFNNLLENAIKYGNNKDIEVQVYAHNNEAIIKIIDQGKGIQESELPYIFEPFYRGDKARTDGNQKGYGLGLAISKETVDKLNGSITVDSSVNTGSTFTIKIPNVLL